jgi:hypothetical protein
VIRVNFLLVYLFCGLVVASCTPPARPSQSTPVTSAATATETVAAAESQPSDSSQEMVCSYESVTGTRFRRRYCATQAERERRQQDDRESGERMQRKGAYANPRPDE